MILAKINDFGYAISGVLNSENYLSFITNGFFNDIPADKYMTVADSRKNLRNDILKISADIKKAIKEAEQKQK